MIYEVGDVANGHVLAANGQWQPLLARQDVNVETAISQSISSKKTTAWLLWLFLGGINAHLAVRYPKQGALIIILSIVFAILTAGISLLAWVFTWAFLLGDWDDMRAAERAKYYGTTV